MVINILRFLKCYSNPVITLITALLFIFFTGDADMASIGGSENNVEAMSKLYAIGAIVFSLLSIWVFSIGALVVLVQLIYGLVKYFTVKENKSEYIHYFIGFAISMFGYIVIFSGSS